MLRVVLAGESELAVRALAPRVSGIELVPSAEGDTAVRVGAIITIDDPERFEPCSEWTIGPAGVSAYARETGCDFIVVANTDVTMEQHASARRAYGGVTETVDVVLPAMP